MKEKPDASRDKAQNFGWGQQAAGGSEGLITSIWRRLHYYGSHGKYLLKGWKKERSIIRSQCAEQCFPHKQHLQR